MRKNFQIAQANELIKDGRIFDLHNLFDFSSATITGTSELIISFRPHAKFAHGFGEISIQVQALDHIELSDQFGTSIICDLIEMGYKSRSDHDDSWLMREDQIEGNEDMFFRFGDGHFIRFHGECAILNEILISPEAARV